MSGNKTQMNKKSHNYILPYKITGFSFDPLWNNLRVRGISTYDIENTFQINPAQINRLKNAHNYTLYSIIDLCNTFQIHPVEMIAFSKSSDPIVRKTNCLQTHDSTYYTNIGKSIQHYRLMRDMTPRELSQQLHIQPCDMERIENGSRECPISLTLLLDISEILNIEPFLLLLNAKP